MRREQCDVLVIGLGPAGGAAAWAAAKGGARVIGAERKAHIGVPVQCAEFIPYPIGRYARSQKIIRQRVEGMVSVLPSGAEQRSDFGGFVIDRAAFDQGLAEAAAEAGAILHTGTTLEALDRGARVARLRDAQGECDVAYRWLVAADGPNSAVAEALGLPRLKLVHSRQYAVPLPRPLHDTTVWLSGEYPGGYAWLFPRGTEANLGIGIDMDYERDMRHPLDALHAQLVREGVVGEQILRRTGGAIPVSGLRERLVVGEIAFVGDAAGFTHPITGAGIAAAVTSGERAGEALAEALRGVPEALAQYESDVRELYQPTIERALRVRESLAWIWKTPAANLDAEQRRGWIAFEEYFAF